MITAATWYLAFTFAHGGAGTAAMSSLQSCLDSAAQEYSINGPQFADAKGDCRSDADEHVRFTVETLEGLRATRGLGAVTGRLHSGAAPSFDKRFGEPR